MDIYVSTYGAKVQVLNGKLKVDTKENTKEFPLETVQTVNLFPGVSITQPAIKELSEKEKHIFWLNHAGVTYAKIVAPKMENILRQKQQFELMDDEKFNLAMAKQFVSAKIRNQLVIAKRLYKKYKKEWNISQIQTLQRNLRKVSTAKSLAVLEGIEGCSAKAYFQLLKGILPSSIGFEKRTKRPPKDCFSATLSFLYTLLYNDFVLAIQCAGLNANIGIMHQIHDNHYALASDLMEEYRAIVCDTVAVKLFCSEKLTFECFDYKEDGSVYLKREARELVVREYESKLLTKLSYVKKQGVGLDYKSSFSIQVHELIRAMEMKDPKQYSPIVIR